MNLGGVVHINKTRIVVIIILCIVLYVYLFVDTKSSTVLQNESKVDLQRILGVSIKAAEIGGLEVVSVADNLRIRSKGKTKEGLNDAVTNGDIRSHCAMKTILNKAHPRISIISEESKSDCTEYKTEVELNDLVYAGKELLVKEKDVNIWIDPLDATKEYTEKLYKYVTTMVCVTVKGIPIIGVIHRPFHQETYWVWVNKEKSTNLKDAALIKPIDKDKPRFIISLSHPGPVEKILKEAYNENDINITAAAGAGYKVLELVNDNTDVYLHLTDIKKWDLCAGNAILSYYGGRMTTKHNESIIYSNAHDVLSNGLIASIKDTHNIVTKLGKL